MVTKRRACGSRKFDLRALGHRTTRFSDPADPHCRVSRRMPSPDTGVGTLLSVYVSGITATAQENPPSDDLPIISVLIVTQPGTGSGGAPFVTMMEPAHLRDDRDPLYTADSPNLGFLRPCAAPTLRSLPPCLVVLVRDGHCRRVSPLAFTANRRR